MDSRSADLMLCMSSLFMSLGLSSSVSSITKEALSRKFNVVLWQAGNHLPAGVGLVKNARQLLLSLLLLLVQQKEAVVDVPWLAGVGWLAGDMALVMAWLA